MARSNGFPFQIIDAAPLNDTGWEVQVIHQRDFDKLCDPRSTWASSPVYDPNQQISARNLFAQPVFYARFRPLCTLSRFRKLALTTEISGMGAGSIELDLDDEFFSTTLTNGEPATTLLEYEHLFHVYENGALRGAFLGQIVAEAIVPEGDATRAITISGPGPADVLRWGMIYSGYFPDPAPITTDATKLQEGPYDFRTTRMGAWQILLADCKKRGTLGFICTAFTDVFDSGGDAWPDQPEAPQDPNIITAILSGSVYFLTDSATLMERAQSELAGMASEFKSLPAPQVTVVGHTDSTNTVAYNQSLSVRRARSVANFLKSKVPQVVLTVSGRGELEPIDTNKTVNGREHNRRVVVTYPQAKPLVPIGTFGPKLGGNLLEQLETWIGLNEDDPSPLRAEYIMLPTFKLLVRREFGTHREKEVVFYEGSANVISRNRDRKRAEIANYAAALAVGGGYVVQSDAESIARFRQRESYLEFTITDATEANRLDVVTGKLAQSKIETTTWTLSVPPYAEGRRVYEDYALGDWVGVSRYLGAAGDVIEPFRVLAITCEVDENGQTKLTELKLQSKDESYLKKLKQRLSNYIGSVKGTQVFIQDDPPPTARIGDLWTPLNPAS